MRLVAALVIVLALVLVACGDDDDAAAITTAAATSTETTTTSAPSPPPTTTTSTTTTTSALPQVPDELAGFEVGSVTLDGDPWLVAIADTRERRSRGLMFVTDLGDLDGMLFVFDTPTSGAFWMKNTLIPLDIAFFRDDGSLVAVLDMVPCGDQEPCPTYGPGEDYQYALEAPAGDLIGLDPSVVLAP
jgi:uncharacterized membrane protein (UPF0127 family)